MDVHQYLSDEESAIFGTSYSDIYDNSVLWTDKQIATILAALERYGLRDDTVVVIASDHGEAFQEHGNEGHAKDLRPPSFPAPPILGILTSRAEGARSGRVLGVTTSGSTAGRCGPTRAAFRCSGSSNAET